MGANDEDQPAPRGLSRRRLIELGGGFAVGAAVGGAAAAGAASRSHGDGGRDGAVVPFDGPGEQAGITTDRPSQLAMAALDLSDDLSGTFGRTELAALMRDWSTAARALMRGASLPGGLGPSSGLGAPADTGESVGLEPAGLTITFGFGPGLFEASRGLMPAGQRPERFEPLPRFRGDELQDEWCGGDLMVAAAADDAQVAVHAIHTLARVARGAARLRWLQRGFIPAAPKGEAPRNLLGFQDGQSQLDHRDPAAASRLLWAGDDAPAWLRGGGTFLVVRRIRLQLEPWDTATLEHQEATIGRTRKAGVFLPATGVGGSAYEGEAAGSTSPGARGSHATVARDAAFATGQILRRPYSYADGILPGTGQVDAGLIFLAYQRSVPGQFVPMQTRLAEHDALGDYATAIGSAVFAIAPASRHARDWVGGVLLD